ncbi:MAG: FxsB family cyclophane-forming radical SAM/SPASM peptide maturase [Actinoplanes sp.]
MEWPQAQLAVPAGWRAAPFTQFVVKVASRCNLACDYCYVYESADQSWRRQPRVMTDETFARACRLIAGHAARHGLGSVGLVFHGGEPLLAGVDTLNRFAGVAREVIGAGVRFSLQTNGVLITEEFADMCVRRGIRVAVSLDGGEDANDRHRVRKDGTSSFSAVRAGLRILTARPEAYAGLLCTVDTANAPVPTYEALLRFAPEEIDFLLPHATWAAPPPRPGTYADWLIAVFDRWFHAPVRQTRVRLFDDLMVAALGGRVASEVVGTAPVRVAVIETDGSLEQVDALKTAYPGAARLLDASGTDPLEAALADPGVVARQIGMAALADECRRCPVVQVCGGGHYAHRYRPGSGFRNPSVYCGDLYPLISHVITTVAGRLGRSGGEPPPR